MNEPTREQIKEFWEWCGIKAVRHDEVSGTWFQPPPIDLNNLFKYAVPKLQETILSTSRNGGYLSNAYFNGHWSGNSRSEDPALALFWAIWEVTEGERRR